MTKNIVFGAVAALVLGTTAAGAADLPIKTKAPPPVAIYDWTGFYIGVSGGGSLGQSTHIDQATGLPDTVGYNVKGGLVGGTIGYNWQMGQIVFGGEADLDYGFMHASNSFGGVSNTYKTNWMTTERLRLGYAVDRALFYVTGGYAGVSTRATINDVPNNFAASQNNWRSGGVIGGGIEYAFTNNISAKAEYLWAPLQNKTYWAGTPDQETNHMSVSLARVGLNHKF